MNKMKKIFTGYPEIRNTLIFFIVVVFLSVIYYLFFSDTDTINLSRPTDVIYSSEDKKISDNETIVASVVYNPELSSLGEMFLNEDNELCFYYISFSTQYIYNSTELFRNDSELVNDENLNYSHKVEKMQFEEVYYLTEEGIAIKNQNDDFVYLVKSSKQKYLVKANQLFVASPNEFYISAMTNCNVDGTAAKQVYVKYTLE